MHLSNVFLVQLPNLSLSFSLLFQWLQLLLVQSYISGSTFVVSLYINSYIFFSTSFCTTFLSAGIATSTSAHVFSFFVFNYYIWPICCNFSVCVYCFIIIMMMMIIIIISIIIWRYFITICNRIEIRSLVVSTKGIWNGVRLQYRW